MLINVEIFFHLLHTYSSEIKGLNLSFFSPVGASIPDHESFYCVFLLNYM